MSPLALILAAASLAQAPIELTVEPGIEAVVLECGARTERSMVNNGMVTFSLIPNSPCKVRWERTVGSIDRPGKWSCTAAGCVAEGIIHRSVSDAPGRVNVIMARPTHQAVEVTCTDGFRVRGTFVQNVATVDGVPNGECVLMFKGGSPSKFKPITPGTYECTVTGPSAACHPAH